MKYGFEDFKAEIEKRKRAHRLGASHYFDGKVKFWFTYETRKKLLEWAGITEALTIERAGDLSIGAIGHSLGKWLAEHFNHNFDEYDKAIDAAYRLGEGGSSLFHHLLDGNHSIWGVLKAVHDVKADDSFLRELFEAVEHLLRDMCSISGINPFFSLSRETFDKISHFLAPFGVSKLYIADALTINAPEIIGGTLGVVAVLLGHKSLEMNAQIAGSLIFSTIAGANPLLLPVAGWAVYKAIKTMQIKQLPSSKLLIPTGKGALVTGITTVTSTFLVGTMPMWLALTAGIATAIGVKKGIGKLGELWQRIYPSFEEFGKKFPDIAKRIHVPT